MSDIRFGTDGWRGIIAEDFTFPNLRRMASATADYFVDQSKTLGRDVLIGYDRRFFSKEFAETVYDIFQTKGLQVQIADSPLPTPAVSVCVRDQKAAWGIQLTASHNPALYNGFKIKDHHGRSAPPEVTTAIEARLSGTSIPKLGDHDDTPRHTFSYWPAYERYARRIIDWKAIRTLKGHIVFEYLHGVGAGIPERLLKGMPLKHSALHSEWDPLFGGLHPEPIDPYLNDLQKAVRKHRARVGIALDGDADRLGAVDDRGQTLTPHQVFPLLALHAIENKGLRGKIVQAVSLGALGERIARHFNLPFEEVPVGFKHVAERMISEPVAAGGEESGGYAIAGGLPERDGVINGLLLLEMMAIKNQSASQLVASMEKRFGAARFRRVDFTLQKPIADKNTFVKDLSSRLPERVAGEAVAEARTGDGLKVILSSGSWVLLRPSGTEPLLRTYAESSSWDKTNALLNWAKKAVTA